MFYKKNLPSITISVLAAYLFLTIVYSLHFHEIADRNAITTINEGESQTEIGHSNDGTCILALIANSLSIISAKNAKIIDLFYQTDEHLISIVFLPNKNIFKSNIFLRGPPPFLI